MVIIFSLDVEGSEFQILKTIPFQEVDIKVINLEISHVGEIFPGTFDDILNYLNANGYDLHFRISLQDTENRKGGPPTIFAGMADVAWNA